MLPLIVNVFWYSAQDEHVQLCFLLHFIEPINVFFINNLEVFKLGISAATNCKRRIASNFEFLPSCQSSKSQDILITHGYVYVQALPLGLLYHIPTRVVCLVIVFPRQMAPNKFIQTQHLNTTLNRTHLCFLVCINCLEGMCLGNDNRI